MKITLQKCLEILQECGAVIVEDSCVTFPSIWIDDGDEFLYLKWIDEDKEEMYTKFKTGDNQEVEVDGTSLFLTDFKGDTIQITPLFVKVLETDTVTQSQQIKHIYSFDSDRPVATEVTDSNGNMKLIEYDHD